MLLPFLACTDTPAEPEAEETTALFKSDRPHVPGYYIEGSIRCPSRDEIDASFWLEDARELGFVWCDDSNSISEVKRDWIRLEGSVVRWKLIRFNPDPNCSSSGTIDVEELNDGRVTLPADPNDDCYGIASFDLRLIRILTIK